MLLFFGKQVPICERLSAIVTLDDITTALGIFRSESFFDKDPCKS
jgi:hypothetical protein